MNGWVWAIDGWIVLVGVLSACSCAILGNYLVLRKLSLMGDAISHAVLPGLAIAFLISHSRSSWSMFVGAVIVGVLTAVLTEALTRYGRVEHGAAMGVVFSVLFAAGIVLIRQAADHVDLDPGCVLYGNIVAVPLDALGGAIPQAVINLAIVMALNVVFVALFYKELRITAFDPDLARSQGIHAGVMHYALMIMVAVTTVANFEAVGSILVIAMLIVPAATAHLLTDRLGVMILLSLILGAFSAIGGHILAVLPRWVGYDIEANTAAMMSVVTGLFFALAVIFSPQWGLLPCLYHRFSLSKQILGEDMLGLLYRWDEMYGRPSQPLEKLRVLAAVGDGWAARRALAQIQRAGYVRSNLVDSKPTIALTERGRGAAADLIGSHRLWESFLAKHFDLERSQLHRAAEQIEHYTTPDLQRELRDELVHPTLDPQGKPIPPRSH